mmetsp:Transcript_9148/g.33767  ORF Transcript_9148/g.33767 Transcript_9148/m.33767 type:complete len:346 (-) Transcript_9148:1636-2673(-)
MSVVRAISSHCTNTVFFNCISTMSSSLTLLCNQCWNELSSVYYVTRCNHVFCERDANDHFSRELKCPACQRELHESDIHEVRLPLSSRDTHHNQGMNMKDAFNSFYTSMSFLLFQATLQRKWIQYKRTQAEKKLKEVQDKWSIREEEIKSMEEKAQNTIMELREDKSRKEQEIRVLRDHYTEKTQELHALRSAYDQMRFGTSSRSGTPTPSALTYEKPGGGGPPFGGASTMRYAHRFQSPPKSAGSSASASHGSSRPAFLSNTNKFAPSAATLRRVSRGGFGSNNAPMTDTNTFTPSSASPFSKTGSATKPTPGRRPLTPSFLKRRKSSSSNLLFSPPTRKASGV